MTFLLTLAVVKDLLAVRFGLGMVQSRIADVTLNGNKTATLVGKSLEEGGATASRTSYYEHHLSGHKLAIEILQKILKTGQYFPILVT